MKIYAQIGGSSQQIGGSLPIGFIEVQSLRPEIGEYVCSPTGQWVVPSEFPDLTNSTFAEYENRWCASELSKTNYDIMAHSEGHTRAPGSLTLLKTYRNALRNHVIDGIVMSSTRPVIGGA